MSLAQKGEKKRGKTDRHPSWLCSCTPHCYKLASTSARQGLLSFPELAFGTKNTGAAQVRSFLSQDCSSKMQSKLWDDNFWGVSSSSICIFVGQRTLAVKTLLKPRL